ncbi:MAG: YcbK family protein [Labilithrix sp.]|nr:YcbK family protein [Labilithrix sp.]
MSAARLWLLGAFALAAASAPGLARGEEGATPKKSASPGKPAAKTAKRTAPATSKRAAAKPRTVAASRAWHTPTPGKSAPVDDAGRPMLTLQALNMPEHVTLAASRETGGFSAEDLDRAAHLLRDPRSGNEHPIDPRLLDLVYRVAVRFSAHEVRIISGYRTPRHGRHSNHAKGRAIDLVVPGASDEDVARFAREQGFVGVGVYPTSGFVHLDVRDRSYFWVDSSGPGKRSRTRGILADLATKSDARAVARGEHGVGPFAIATDVDGALAAARKENEALAARGSASDTAATGDDDDDDDVDDEAADAP